MKKPIEWKTPKQYQPSWDKEHLNLPAKPPRSRAKYCKRFKGPHHYGEWHLVISSWSNKPFIGFYERFCVACNKKDMWLAPGLRGAFWEPDPDARPPGYIAKCLET